MGKAELGQIAEQMLASDAQITAHPQYTVQQRVRDYGIDPNYSDAWIWHNADGDWEMADEEGARRLDELEESSEDTGSWHRVHYRDRWEFVTACVSEQGCRDFIRTNGHNLTDPRVYVASGHRNMEWRALRAELTRMVHDQEADER